MWEVYQRNLHDTCLCIVFNTDIPFIKPATDNEACAVWHSDFYAFHRAQQTVEEVFLCPIICTMPLDADRGGRGCGSDEGVGGD